MKICLDINNSIRLQWLDIAKGLTIILMVLGHTSIPEFASRFIWAFHMPLFFISSGWTTNQKKKNLVVFTCHKFRTIMIPFFVYSAIVLTIEKIAFGGAIFQNWLEKGWQGYALWFIPVLFLSSILGKLIYLVNNRYCRYLLMVILVIIGASLRYFKIEVPWNLCSVPYACFLILLGTELRQLQSYINTPRWWLLIGGFVVTVVISRFWKMDMAWNNILPVLPLTIGAVAGTLMMFSLSAYIEKYSVYATKLLSKIGQETFVVVAFSQIIMMVMIQYTSWSSLIRYLILAVSLVSIVVIKNFIKKLLTR